MDLLILYSPALRGQLLSLASLLHQKAVRFLPLELPRGWTVNESEDLHHYLQDHTHWLFLLDPADFANPAFLFAAGYCVAISERTFVLETEPGSLPGSWKSHLHVCPDFTTLVLALAAEKTRWGVFLARLEAKGKLVERGLEATNSAFVEAVERGDAGSVELFLQAGFSPDLTNKKGVTVLGLAVRAQHLSVVRLLLDGGADIDLRSRDRDNSPLMDAAAEGLHEIVEELTARGAEVGGVSRNGQNALVLAVGKGAEEVAIRLLEVGADPFVPDKLGMNAVQYGQLLGRKAFLAKVTERYPDRT